MDTMTKTEILAQISQAIDALKSPPVAYTFGVMEGKEGLVVGTGACVSDYHPSLVVKVAEQLCGQLKKSAAQPVRRATSLKDALDEVVAEENRTFRGANAMMMRDGKSDKEETIQ